MLSGYMPGIKEKNFWNAFCPNLPEIYPDTLCHTTFFSHGHFLVIDVVHVACVQWWRMVCSGGEWWAVVCQVCAVAVVCDCVWQWCVNGGDFPGNYPELPGYSRKKVRVFTRKYFLGNFRVITRKLPGFSSMEFQIFMPRYKFKRLLM